MTSSALANRRLASPELPDVELSPGAERRLREAKTFLPVVALVWGGLFGAIAWLFDERFGIAVLAASGALCLPPLAFWSRVRRRTRWMFALALAGVLYLQCTFLCVGLAAGSVTSPPWAVVGVGVATLGLVAWRLPRDVARFDAEWETHRAVNEREILDLDAGTYDLDRRFVPLTGGGRGIVVEGAGDAAAIASRFTPLVAAAATLGSVLAGHGAADFRVTALALLGPVATVLFTPALAQAVVHVRRLRGYERRIGRPILNR